MCRFHQRWAGARRSHLNALSSHRPRAGWCPGGVEREPIGRPAAEGVELGEDEISVSVYAERPVVDKRVVAVERVRLEKGVELDDVTIEDELRVERVAVDEGDE